MKKYGKFEHSAQELRMPPWFAVLTSLTAIVVSIAALSITIYRWRRELRDAIPAFVVNAKPGYETMDDDECCWVATEVDVIAVNVSTTNATVTGVGVAPVHSGLGAIWFTPYNPRHDVVPPRGSLHVTLTGADLGPDRFRRRVDVGDSLSEILAHVKVEGIGGDGRPAEWRSSPFKLRRGLEEEPSQPD